MDRLVTFHPLPNYDQASVSGTLEKILWALMLAGFLPLSAALLVPSFPIQWVGAAAILYAVCLTTFGLSRRGYLRAASFLLIATMWVFTTLSALRTGGTFSRATTYYFIVILLAGLLLGTRAGIWTAVLCILAVLVFAIMELTGHALAPLPEHTPVTRWLGFAWLGIAVLGLQYLGTRTSDHALRQTRSELAQHHQAETALRTSENRLRALLARIQAGHEKEGTRLAREIHNELGAALTGLMWNLENVGKILERSGTPVAAHEQIVKMISFIEPTINSVRRIAHEVRPSMLDDLGLIAALEWQTKQFHTRTGLICHWGSTLERIELKHESATAVFRIFQEILKNVQAHSQANNLYVKLRQRQEKLELEVRDDGRGITEAERADTASLGLLEMKERALLVGGEVEITGGQGRGTTVLVSVPLSGIDGCEPAAS